jgi:hypothetical protein
MDCASAVTSLADVAAPAETADALSRPLYCILGLPIDAIDMAGALKRIALPPPVRAGSSFRPRISISWRRRRLGNRPARRGGHRMLSPCP